MGAKRRTLVGWVLTCVGTIALCISAGGCGSGRPAEAMRSVHLGDGVNLELVWCAPGSFVMGAPLGETRGNTGEKQHHVTLTKGFWIGRYEVTQKQWEAVMKTSPSGFDGTNRPVETVSWHDCSKFAERLSSQVRGAKFRLPTEAEWEYACRAGTTTAFNSGKGLTKQEGRCTNADEVAWYDQNSDQETHPVGLKQPNGWGLYDMHGNVREWCMDLYADYPSSPAVDPAGPAADPKAPPAGKVHVVRGGSHGYWASACSAASRGKEYPGQSHKHLGFRIVLEAD